MALSGLLSQGEEAGWTRGASYTAGAKVMFRGLGYIAKWDNQGDSPATSINDPTGSAWRSLYRIPGEPVN